MTERKPAHNEHIGSMAALPPLERVCGNASLSPAGKCLKPPLPKYAKTLAAMAESVSEK